MRVPVPFLLAVSLLAGCFETSTGPVPFDTERYAFDFPAGRTRLMVRTFTVHWEARDSTRTYHMLGWMRVEKDTVFEGFPAKVVEGRFWEPYTDSVLRYRTRELYVNEDSQVSVYQFRSEAYSPFLVGLLKTATPDTNVFSDRAIVVRYPLVPDRKWKIRLDTDPFSNLALEKEFTGKDTLEFQGRRYVCGMLALRTLGDVPLKSWIARIGLIKAEVEYGKTPAIDTADNVVDTLRSTESYALLDLDVDSTAAERYFDQYRNGPFPRQPPEDAPAGP